MAGLFRVFCNLRSDVIIIIIIIIIFGFFLSLAREEKNNADTFI